MKEKIKQIITEFINNYKIKNNTQTDWNEPLVAFADTNDPLFRQLKSIVGPTHNLPNDLLDDAKTVISYFIPFKKEIVLSNVGKKHCSREWTLAYIETNKLIIDLNKHLSKELEKLNFKTAILPPTHNFDEVKLISDWSHKHISFIAGLGKFGLHQMLITEKGCCGRLGSLITNAKIEPTKRQYKEFCLYKYNGTCKKCVANCTFGALKIDSYDRHKCYEICLCNDKFYSEFGLADICGKCVCVIPCSFINPVK